jgi:4-amino-4-deoxy-L-arabinose transferase-like glycosyltransferase
VWSWRKWPDVHVDFGNQLYLPWQITEGRHLYRDIDYKEGPLSIYLNALLFLLFGVSLTTLVWVNLLLLATLVALIYALFGRACDRWTATVVCLVVLVVFGFSQYTGAGNYNYVCPYTHEQTHGLLLAVLVVALLGRWARTGRALWSGLAGLCLGLVFLTKTELFVPAAAAALLGHGLVLAMAPRDLGRTGGALAAFAAGALAPPAACFAFFLVHMPAATALRGVAGNWVHVSAGVLDDRFYLAAMGLDDVAGNVGTMLKVFLGIVALAGLAAVADRVTSRARTLAAAAGGVALFAALAANPDLVPWRFVGRALPLTSLAAALALAVHCLRRRRDRALVVRLVPLAMWAVLALVLLFKVVLNVRLSHYGFVLAMPATALLTAMLVWGVPAALRARADGGRVARALLLAPVLAGALFYLRWSGWLYAQKDLVVGTGGDAIVAENAGVDPAPAAIARAAERLAPRLPPGATLLVLPEGTILNYWLRRPNPTRYTLFTPSAINFAGGETRIVEDFGAHPPDVIALVHRETDEFGMGYFGADPRYGRTIMDWVERHYVRVERIGAEPFGDRRFGIVLLARSAARP